VNLKQVVYIPSQTAPGLGPPRHQDGAWVNPCLMPDE